MAFVSMIMPRPVTTLANSVFMGNNYHGNPLFASIFIISTPRTDHLRITGRNEAGCFPARTLLPLDKLGIKM
ncbi:MAG: hypothetical protein GY737_11420 [Desulfobacteraceae bacterium]|nr:hypothetical protein [Desulfobacteraceae bacterium]